MIGKIILITLQWQWTPENFFEFSLRKGKMIKIPFVCIVRLEGRGHKAQNTVAGRREVCVLVSPRGAWGHQVNLLCCREPHLYAVLRMLLLCCVTLMFPLASASLDGRCCQGQSWPAVPGDRFGRLNGWNLLLSYMSRRLWTWFLTSSPSFYLSSSVSPSVNCQSPGDSIGEMYLREYPKHFEHIQGTVT